MNEKKIICPKCGHSEITYQQIELEGSPYCGWVSTLFCCSCSNCDHEFEVSINYDTKIDEIRYNTYDNDDDCGDYSDYDD